MEMLVKKFECFVPDDEGNVIEEFSLNVTHAPGSDSVNLIFPDFFVLVEKLSWYTHRGVKTVDQLLDYLYYVKA